jgi:hypothetical protein
MLRTATALKALHDPHLAFFVSTGCTTQLGSQEWLKNRATLPCMHSHTSRGQGIFAGPFSPPQGATSTLSPLLLRILP